MEDINWDEYKGRMSDFDDAAMKLITAFKKLNTLHVSREYSVYLKKEVRITVTVEQTKPKE